MPISSYYTPLQVAIIDTLNEGTNVSGRLPVQSTLGDPGAVGSDQAPAHSDHVHDRNNDAALYWMVVGP